MTASRQAAQDTQPSSWRLATNFAAIGMASYVALALLDAAREARLQHDAAWSEQRRLRLAMQELNDKITAFSLALAPSTMGSLSASSGEVSAPVARKSTSAARTSKRSRPQSEGDAS